MHKKVYYYRTNEHVNYFIVNGEALLDCIDYFLEKDLLTSTEFLQSFTDIYNKMDRNFVELYMQKSEKLKKNKPTANHRMYFALLHYLVVDCSRLLKLGANNKIDKPKFVERIKTLRNFGNMVLEYRNTN